MAVSDILSSSTNWPLAAMEGLLSSSNPMGASTFVCKLGMYCRVFSQAISVQSLVFIAGDRFNAIVRPFKAIHVGTKHRTAVMMFTWISSLSLCSPYVVSSKIVIHGRYTFCSSNIVLYTACVNLSTLRADHENFEACDSRGGRTKQAEKDASVSNDYENFRLDCKRLFHMLDSASSLRDI
ncbi:hypothetical protein P5673_013402 [Acropora cervicornis]|uniref:G-protein coupled receptors family 1 profile domain-containing protein n=1 Tax=Acropora cervicornis TaxID=6130 RepID=A0AAD9QKK1_ACRCE|nr:hypothetical protein P5673_013402 [Acropora cervicornis]